MLYLSGVTGTTVDGEVSSDPGEQFEQAFVHLSQYLAALSAIVKLTTYHVSLREHLDASRAVKDRHIGKPYPVWSAIGVSELITPGALVEVRVTADDRLV